MYSREFCHLWKYKIENYSIPFMKLPFNSSLISNQAQRACFVLVVCLRVKETWHPFQEAEFWWYDGCQAVGRVWFRSWMSPKSLTLTEGATYGRSLWKEVTLWSCYSRLAVRRWGLVRVGDSGHDPREHLPPWLLHSFCFLSSMCSCQAFLPKTHVSQSKPLPLHMCVSMTRKWRRWWICYHKGALWS